MASPKEDEKVHLKKETHFKDLVSDIFSKLVRGSAKDRLLWKTVVELASYFIFLTATLILATYSRSISMFYFQKLIDEHYILRKTTNRFGYSLNFRNLVTTSDWWNYIENKFLVDFHEGFQVLDEEGKHFVLEESLLLGPARFRQKRIFRNSCLMHKGFRKYFQYCYGQFDKSNEDKRPEYKGTRYVNPTPGQDLFYNGNLHNYGRGGYVKELTFDLERNKQIVKELIDMEWLDRATRFILVEFTLYNPNENLFNSFKIAAELPSSGGILVDVQQKVISVHTFWTTSQNYFIWIVCAIFYACLIINWISTIFKCIAMGLFNYLKSFWNIINSICLILFTLCVCYHFWHPRYVALIEKRFTDNPLEYTSLDTLAYYFSFYMNMFAIASYLLLFSMFKFFYLNKTLLQFATTMKRCIRDVIGFGIIFVIVFLTYAITGLVMFCSNHTEFKDMRSCMYTLLKMIVGVFDYSKLENTNRILGPIYFVSYILIVFFILLNTFLAIISDTYLNVKKEVRSGELDFQSFMGQKLKECKKKMQDGCRRRQETQTFDEDDESGEEEVVDNIYIRRSELLRNYFEMIPNPALTDLAEQHQKKVDQDFKRLQNRVIATEVALEQLIISLERIVASKKYNFLPKEKEKRKTPRLFFKTK